MDWRRSWKVFGRRLCSFSPRSPTVYHGSVHHHCLTSSGTVVLTFSPAKLLCSWVLLSDDNFFVNTLDAGLRLLSLACLFLLVCLPLLIVAEALWQDVPYSCVLHKQYLFVSITKSGWTKKLSGIITISLPFVSMWHNLSMTLPVSLLFKWMMNGIDLFLACLLSCPVLFFEDLKKCDR